MHPPSPLIAALVTRLGFDLHPGQPVVLAFSRALEVSESASLQRVRAELRGLGAALLWLGRDQAFVFHPDDAFDLDGSQQGCSVELADEIRVACGLEARANSERELCLLVVSGDGIVVGRHRVEASDGLLALADALTLAGREAIAPRHPLLLSRRDVVLASLVGAFALLANEGCHQPAHSAPPPIVEQPHRARTVAITLNVNGQSHALEVEPRVSLLDALRERLGLTGSKKGCDHGQCGACTVLVAGRRVNACLTLAVMVGSDPITTIEGLAQGDHLHPMQAAFVGEDALQCGYCTPGQIMSALGLVRENRAHSDAEVREHMSGNICRCGAYGNIVAAIQRARSESTSG